MYAASPRRFSIPLQQPFATRAHARLIGLLALLLVAQIALAQTPKPFPEPNLDLWSEGIVTAIESDGSGGYYVGGRFTHLARQPRASLGHVLADGSLNPAFAPSISGDVLSIVRLADGSLIVGGLFTQVNGVNRANLARLNANGSLDTSWTPTANGQVVRLLLDASTLYVGGDFTQLGGLARSRVGRIEMNSGTVDPAWAPVASGRVNAFAVTSDNRVWVGGNFATMNGSPANLVVRLNAATGANDRTLPISSGVINRLQIDANDNLYICGGFNITGLLFSQVARISPTGAAQQWGAPLRNAGASGFANDCQLDGENLYVTGSFDEIDGQTRRGVARLLAGGALDPNFVVAARTRKFGIQFDPRTRVIARVSPTQVVFGGYLTFANDQLRAGLAAVSVADATLLPAVDAERSGIVTAVEFLATNNGLVADGWLVGGDFLRAGDVVRENILRLTVDGALDPDWALSVDGAVTSFKSSVFQPIAFVGGTFSNAGDLPRTNLFKLEHVDLDVVDPAWSPNPNGQVTTLHFDGQNTDRIFVGGLFTQIAGQTRNRLARISTVGTGLADAYDANLNNQVYAITQSGPGNNLYVGGIFTQAAGQARSFLAVFSSGATATLQATSFNPNGGVWALRESGFDEVVIGGDFTVFGGQPRARLAKLSSGALDSLWQPSANSRVLSLQSDNSRNLYLGGFFTQLNGLPRSAIGKLSLDGIGSIDGNFRPNADAAVSALSVGVDSLTVGGFFTQMAGQSRRALAAMPFDGQPPLPEEIFVDGFEPLATSLIQTVGKRGIGTACDGEATQPLDPVAHMIWQASDACSRLQATPATQP